MVLKRPSFLALSLILLVGIRIALTLTAPLPLQEKEPPLFTVNFLKKAYNASFFYYLHTLELEHLGDLHGDRWSLKHYDPALLKRWFKGLEDLDASRDLLPFLVTFYFADPSAPPALLKTCITFLQAHSKTNLSRKWRWATYGVYLAEHHLKDPSYALTLAQNLAAHSRSTSVPLWVQELPARLLQQTNRLQEAYDVYKFLLQDKGASLSPEEKAWLTYQLGLLKPLP